MTQFTAANGIVYTVRFVGQDLEIERPDEPTGLIKVFVFKGFSIGNFTSQRKETIFFSYLIVNGQRIDEKKLVLPDAPDEFAAFIASELWDTLRNKIIDDFLREVDYTAR